MVKMILFISLFLILITPYKGFSKTNVLIVNTFSQFNYSEKVLTSLQKNLPSNKFNLFSYYIGNTYSQNYTLYYSIDLNFYLKNVKYIIIRNSVYKYIKYYEGVDYFKNKSVISYDDSNVFFNGKVYKLSNDCINAYLQTIHISKVYIFVNHKSGLKLYKHLNQYYKNEMPIKIVISNNLLTFEQRIEQIPNYSLVLIDFQNIKGIRGINSSDFESLMDLKSFNDNVYLIDSNSCQYSKIGEKIAELIKNNS